MATIPAPAILDGLIIGIDHIGVCVRDIDQTAGPWTQLLGCPVTDREEIAVQKVRVGWLRLSGSNADGPGSNATAIELVSSLGNAGLDKFLERRGNAMHHVAITVSDIHQALRRIKSAGLRLIDQEPRVGALGHLVAFLHPTAMAGILVELVQHSDE